MRVAICQPTYLPWIGYFDLIDQVDIFVLLDVVQFEKQSWQQRNRIKTPKGLQWLTVPVVFRGRFGQKICEVEIRDPDFVKAHLRAIEVNYGRSRFFSDSFPALSSILRKTEAGETLLGLNLRLLQWLTRVLRIDTPLVLASSLGQEGRRTELLAKICQKLGARQYVSPIGSAEYLLAESTVLENADVATLFHNYLHPEYAQRFPPFVPYASAIDLIFNEGEGAMNIIRSGRRSLLTTEQVLAKMAEAKEA